MKGIAFSDMRSYQTEQVNPRGKGQDACTGESFLQVFDKTQGQTQKAGTKDTAKTADAEEVQEYKGIRKSRFSDKVKETKKDAVSDEAIEEAAAEIEKKIADLLDVSVEEVEKVLETMGLSVVDLLNTDILTQVVMELNPNMDAMQLMTNEEMFADLKSLTNFAEEVKSQLCDQFQMTEDELKAAVDAVKEMKKLQNPQPEVDLEVMEAVTAQTEDGDEELHSVKNSRVIEDHTTVGEQIADETITVKVEDSRQTKNSDSRQENTGSQESFKNFYDRLSEAVDKATESSASYSGVSGQDIIRQVTDSIRVHIKPEMTEMEMQLHPASLGNLKVQLVSTGGVLTAVFTTENETVKASLEAQLVQLKENFVQQGLKVESVEVNVSAQGFERSLDQQEKNQDSYEEAQEKKGNRRIRLQGLGEADINSLEEIAQEDKVVADMMIRNGNSVDYTV